MDIDRKKSRLSIDRQKTNSYELVNEKQVKEGWIYIGERAMDDLVYEKGKYIFKIDIVNVANLK